MKRKHLESSRLEQSREGQQEVRESTCQEETEKGRGVNIQHKRRKLTIEQRNYRTRVRVRDTHLSSTYTRKQKRRRKGTNSNKRLREGSLQIEDIEKRHKRRHKRKERQSKRKAAKQRNDGGKKKAKVDKRQQQSGSERQLTAQGEG